MIKLKLLQPEDGATLQGAKPRFEWSPLRSTSGVVKPRYAFSLFTVRLSGSHGRKPRLIFSHKGLKRNFVDFPVREKGLKPGKTYWWQIHAYDGRGDLVAASERRRFRVRKRIESVPDIEISHPGLHHDGYIMTDDPALRLPGATSLLAQLLPSPPTAWGMPVRLRSRAALEEDAEPTPPPEGGPGTLEPQALVWGAAAGEIYLTPHMARHCSVYWDLSGVPGCDSVLFQISGADGFAEPNNGNVMDDASVINYFWGPPRITCSAQELETHLEPLPDGRLAYAENIDLFEAIHASDVTELPEEDHAPFEVGWQLRTIPCNADREPVNVASDPVVVHCVPYPHIRVQHAGCTWTWGDSPSRDIEFSVYFQDHYPGVSRTPLPDAPATLLIYTPPVVSTMLEPSCSHVTFTMSEGITATQNRIVMQKDGPDCDTFVIPLEEWPDSSYLAFTLSQDWQGGITPDTLVDFLKASITAAVIPGIRSSWSYCGGADSNYDSLRGRDDLPDEPTRSPLYTHEDCMPTAIIRDRVLNGLMDFNEFMSSTFRGTRTVTIDGSVDDVGVASVDETAGTMDVTVNFETEGTTDIRYAMPLTTQPVFMREQRDSGEVLWKVAILDGKYASLRTTGSSINTLYSGRDGAIAGISRFDPPRMQLWISTQIGTDSHFQRVWADVYYDLTGT